MTQNTFAPPPLAAPEVDEQAGGTRRAALVAGGVAAAVALAGAGYFLLSGGSDPVPSSAPAATLGIKTVKPVVAKKAATKVVKPAVKVPPTSTVPLGRDPFHALYLAPAVAATTTAPTTSAPTTSTPTTTAPTTPTTTAPKSYRLVLTGVSGSGKNLTATFNVAGKIMVAKVGSVFGPTSELKLLSLQEDTKGVWVATIQVGDSEPVDAPKGKTLYVG